MRAIADRGKLIAGVSQDTLLFSYLDPLSRQLEGFDIDVVKQVSHAIFGDENHVEYRTINSAQRIPMLQDSERLLVPRTSTAQSLQDLGGKKVCAPTGSTAVDQIARASSHPIPVQVPERSDCLLMLQQGQVDAAANDETILLGLAFQDQSVKVVGPRFTDEPYGLGISQQRPDFVRFVNAMLERMRADGTWTAIYNRWLSRFGAAPPPPPAAYKD